MCDLRSGTRTVLIHSALLAGCPVNTFLVRGWMPYKAKFVYSGFTEDEQEPPGFVCSRKLESPVVWHNGRFCRADTAVHMHADGYYLLEDRELYLTDGNGHFFWAATDHSSSNPATVAVWDPEYCSFSDTAPCFSTRPAAITF